jgi:drug/metabolite transporter (DMT)-like permease
MNINLIYIGIIALLWGICPHLDKLVLDHIEYDQYWILSRCWINGLVILLIVSFLYIRKMDIRQDIKKISNKAWIFAMAATILANIGLFINYYIIRRIGVSETTAVLSPLALLVTMLYGYLLFGEKLNTYQIIGAMLTMTGMYIVISNSNDLK